MQLPYSAGREHAGPRHHGAVAQLGERCVRNAEVEGSTPFRSTLFSLLRRRGCMPFAGSELLNVRLEHRVRFAGVRPDRLEVRADDLAVA